MDDVIDRQQMNELFIMLRGLCSYLNFAVFELLFLFCAYEKDGSWSYIEVEEETSACIKWKYEFLYKHA